MRFDPMRVRCVFALTLALCATRAAGQYNILQNPDFSTNLGSWAPVAASGAYWAWDSDGMASGGTAIGLNALAYGPGSIVLRQCVPVSQAVTKHTLHGVVRVASNQGTTGSAAMRWRYYGNTACTGSGAFPVHSGPAVTDSGWQWREVSEPSAWLTQPGAVAALIEMVVTKDTASGTFAAEFDHVYFGPPLRVKGDFDSDGKVDLILRQSGGSSYQVWIMNGTTRLGAPWAALSLPQAPWQLVGTDDFNMDAWQDGVFRHPLTGAVQLALMVGNVGPTFGLVLPNTPGPQWTIDATADVNHDGSPDLLWRDTSTGELLVWTMNRTQQQGTIIPYPDAAPAGAWRVVAARDFSGDNNVDLLWQDAASGDALLWVMDAGFSRVAEQPLVPDNQGGSAWRIVATGDYGTGPGGVNFTNDVVWRHDTTGKLVLWYMDTAGKRTSGTYLTPDSAQPDPLGWDVVGPR